MRLVHATDTQTFEFVHVSTQSLLLCMIKGVESAVGDADLHDAHGQA